MCKLDDFGCTGIWSYPAASLRVGNATLSTVALHSVPERL